MRSGRGRGPGRRPGRLPLLLLGSSLLAAAAPALHLELLGSYPRHEQSVANPPVEVSLIFSESADPALSSLVVTGPDGEVPLAPLRAQDEGLVLLARVEGAMPPGSYTAAWKAAAPDVDPVEGRFRFRVGR